MGSVNTHMTIEQLKQRALKRLNMQSENASYNRVQIQRVASKSEPLTDEDIAQLEHFIGIKQHDLGKFTYYGNTIVDPSVWGKETYRLDAKTGKYVCIQRHTKQTDK